MVHELWENRCNIIHMHVYIPNTIFFLDVQAAKYRSIYESMRAPLILKFIQVHVNIRLHGQRLYKTLDFSLEILSILLFDNDLLINPIYWYKMRKEKKRETAAIFDSNEIY